ncbi:MULTISPECIES: MarR family winged helix-turn-helix transcriptional regulator [Staphylococcus]|uniref:MarR family winged helix-turn-helix transcriptional regulator n=1 Tax=Staphylococcus TaxID=1279 RepID=UPI000D033FE9|nr:MULTISPECIES: MarR family transcriptional regulator [Staphylococcus]MCD8915663.1 MarR family transcriptional regulator [Staphylococcus simulans]UXV35539.1 MarR family transcriptional regulator [Staphylococcus sp. IVB6181]
MATTIQYLLRMITNEMKVKADHLLEPYGITQEQAQTLRYIYESDTGKVAQTDLIQIFNRKGPTVSSALRSLENKKLIERISVPEDTRKKEVVLTALAKKDVREIIAILDEVEAVLFYEIPKADQNALKEILYKMQDNLRTLDSEAGPF